MQVEVAYATSEPDVVGDPALGSADRASGLHHFADRGEPPRPDRLEEVDLQLDRRERLFLFEQREIGAAQRAVGEVAEDPAVHVPGGLECCWPASSTNVTRPGSAATIRMPSSSATGAPSSSPAMIFCSTRSVTA